MQPDEALKILTQVVEQTRALPNEVDMMRQALQVLNEAVTKKPEK